MRRRPRSANGIAELRSARREYIASWPGIATAKIAYPGIWGLTRFYAYTIVLACPRDKVVWGGRQAECFLALARVQSGRKVSWSADGKPDNAPSASSF